MARASIASPHSGPAVMLINMTLTFHRHAIQQQPSQLHSCIFFPPQCCLQSSSNQWMACIAHQSALCSNTICPKMPSKSQKSLSNGSWRGNTGHGCPCLRMKGALFAPKKFKISHGAVAGLLRMQQIGIHGARERSICCSFSICGASVLDIMKGFRMCRADETLSLRAELDEAWLLQGVPRAILAILLMEPDHGALTWLCTRLQLTVRETLDFSARCYGIGAKSGETCSTTS